MTIAKSILTLSFVINCALYASSQLFPVKQWKKLSVEEIERWSSVISEQLHGPCTVVKYTILSYRDESSTIPEDAEVGESRFFNSGSWGLVMGSETFRNKDMEVSVNHSSQVIYVGSNSGVSISDPIGDWAKLLNSQTEVSKSLTSDGTVIRVKYHQYADVNQSEMWLNNENQLQKSVIYLNRSVEVETSNGPKVFRPRIEVKFDLIRQGSDCSDGKYSIESVLKSVKKGQVVPTERYRNYKIVDTRPSSTK
jgi:hypothetical protein